MKGLLSFFPVMALIMVGCQKSGSLGPVPNLESSQSKMMECRIGSESVSISEAGIEGVERIKSGQPAALALGEKVDCGSAEKATWSIGSKVIGTGARIAARINGTGFYFVTVTSSGESNGMESKLSDSPSISSKVAVTDSQVLIVGPQAGTEGETYRFSLAVPDGEQVTQASWSFGDDTPTVNSLGPVEHSFLAGSYEISVQITKSSLETQVLKHSISILPVLEGPHCPLDQMEIVGPTEVPVARPIEYSLNLTPCLKDLVQAVSWDFGDGTAPVSGQTAQHRFQNTGTYTIKATVSMGAGPDAPSVTLVRQVTVFDNMEQMPGPVDDTPVDPLQCVEQGETRSSEGATTTKIQSCGIDGQRADTFKEQITETCEMVGGALKWKETSRSQILINEGTCEGQSCELSTANGKEILKDLESRVLYTSSSPTQSCATVQETRTCRNGVLSGSSDAKHSMCHNGCGDFGAHGTEKTDVVIGEIRVPKTCQFGEEGVFDVVNEIADMRCEDGEVKTSKTRQGQVTSAGICPRYQYQQTEVWTQCSADCGGNQSRVFECRDDQGKKAPAERCLGNIPVENRICDGNPGAAKRTETIVRKEEAPASRSCPKNQIGVILNEREVTETKSFACIDHKVQFAGTEVTNGAWVTESFCRDFTPHRCNHDSLSLTEAKGRYAWMVKCQDQVPAIKDFLSHFEDVSYRKAQIDEGQRRLYPTFMDSGTKKAWIAPKKSQASCEVPESIYVAAVCVASCSTPEQQILVEAVNERKLKYMPFVEALTQKVPVVATLHSSSSMSSKTVAKARVDNWVTELVDSEHEILVFKMKSGGQLKLTPNHPLLSQDGRMKMASDFKERESLVQLGGTLDEILSIEQTPYYGKVYNLFVKSNDPKKNVVVTNGYLNGTAFYQNEGAKNMNRALFREHLFRGAFENKGSRK